MSYPPPGEPQDPRDPQQQPPQYGQEGEQQQYGPQYGQQGEAGAAQGPYGPSGPYTHPGQYGQPGPYAQYPPPGYGPATGTNTLAILSLVFAFVFSPAGIVLGHLARRQIRQTGEQGAQLANWGLVLSYIFTALSLLACCAWIGVLIWAGSDGGTGSY